MKHALVIILGMHRSGTSLCARICQQLGVYLGDNLIPGQSDNPDGYFENRFIVRTHHRILCKLNGNRDAANKFLRFPPNWEVDPHIMNHAVELSEQINQLLCNAGSGLAGFKDPRTARLLPLWEELYCKLNIKPVFILSVRHPYQVSQSLNHRENMGQAQSDLLWLQHNVAALSVKHKMLVIDYDRWFADFDKQLAQLSNYLEASGSIVRNCRENIINIVDCQKYHHQVANRSYFHECDELYSLLRAHSIAGAETPSNSIMQQVALCVQNEDRMINTVLAN